MVGRQTPGCASEVKRIAVLAILTALAGAADGRDLAQRQAFRNLSPCPATGKARGACPGYVVDHIRPLCAGGADRPSNMQWQTTADAKVKDLAELRECRAARARGLRQGAGVAPEPSAASG